jgi:sugar phosphate isomerase/epimerase
MELLLFRHNWGLPEASWELKLAAIGQGGFAGVETGELLPTDYSRFQDLLQKHKLRFIPQIFTTGTGVGEHLASFRKQLTAVSRFSPIRVNCHSGSDRWGFDEAKRFYGEALQVEADAEFPVAHETHRGRCLFHPWAAARLLEAYPQLRLCADFSHWVCVCERLLNSEEGILRECARRAVHIHARVGFENGPQVNDPRAPEWKSHVEAHERWWTWIWEAQRALGASCVTLTPEFGPPTYLPTHPHTQAPIANLQEICNWQAQRQAQRFKEWSSGTLSEPQNPQDDKKPASGSTNSFGRSPFSNRENSFWRCE